MTLDVNEALARDLWVAIAEGDAGALRKLLSPKCKWKMYGRSPLAGEYTGVDEILGFMAKVGELVDELESSLLEIFEAPDGVVLRYAIHAKRRDRVLDTEHLFLIRIDRKRIVSGVFTPIDQEVYDAFWIDEPVLGS